MPPFKSQINTASDEFRQRYAHNKSLVMEFRNKQFSARYDRPQRDLDRLKKYKKQTTRERLAKLLDPGTPFLELCSLAANMAYDGDSPSASTVIGIGIVSGREVIIHADDPSIKGGA